MNVQIARGLEGVVVDQTAISNVEGDCGRLSYRGYLIEDLVTRRYEDVVWLVIFGELPDDDQWRSMESLGDNSLAASPNYFRRPRPRPPRRRTRPTA